MANHEFDEAINNMQENIQKEVYKQMHIHCLNMIHISYVFIFLILEFLYVIHIFVKFTNVLTINKLNCNL